VGNPVQKCGQAAKLAFEAEDWPCVRACQPMVLAPKNAKDFLKNDLRSRWLALCFIVDRGPARVKMRALKFEIDNIEI
jgi:hypothetical protein